MTGAVELTPGLLDDIAETLAPVFAEQRALWSEHGPAAMEAFNATGATLATIGGNCPVQAEGTVDGQPFYFRARGERWELWIGQPAGWWTDRAWSTEQDYGTWPDAGWMPRHEAMRFIVEGIRRYRQQPASIKGESA